MENTSSGHEKSVRNTKWILHQIFRLCKNGEDFFPLQVICALSATECTETQSREFSLAFLWPFIIFGLSKRSLLLPQRHKAHLLLLENAHTRPVSQFYFISWPHVSLKWLRAIDPTCFSLRLRYLIQAAKTMKFASIYFFQCKSKVAPLSSMCNLVTSTFSCLFWLCFPSYQVFERVIIPWKWHI